MSQLFTPYDLRGTSVRNRVWVSPMCQYSAVDGLPGDWHLVHLGSFARGGVGLVMTEASAVSPEGRISPQDSGIWNDEQRDAWARIVDFVHGQGAVAAVQLAHAGRKASTRRPWDGRGSVAEEDGGWETVGPSAVAFPGLREPRELTAEGIAAVVDDFAAAAKRSLEAGFDVIEVHAAHGYLLHEFLSPLSNRRTDEYGGSFDNRVRLLLDVVRAVGAAVPGETPLVVRISATDWADIPVEPGYQVGFARRIRQEAGIATGAVGLITEAKQAEEVVAEGSADVVFLARALLRDPHWALQAAHELGVEIGAGVHWPDQYRRAALD